MRVELVSTTLLQRGPLQDTNRQDCCRTVQHSLWDGLGDWKGFGTIREKPTARLPESASRTDETIKLSPLQERRTRRPRVVLQAT